MVSFIRGPRNGSIPKTKTVARVGGGFPLRRVVWKFKEIPAAS